jgi:hypothetical protein
MHRGRYAKLSIATRSGQPIAASNQRKAAAYLPHYLRLLGPRLGEVRTFTSSPPAEARPKAWRPGGLLGCERATRTELFRRWHDLMDLNAGDVVDGLCTVEVMGWRLFLLLLDMASGKQLTWAER